MKKPHIIYILSDEHRGQAMSHAGDPNVQTPHLDALAAEGASFARAYANCPICTPSRGTLFSGRHAHCGPVSHFFGAYPISAPSTATWLRECGYHTSYIGKWHCGVVHDQRSAKVLANPGDYPGMSTRTPENRRGGFQDWAGFECINSPFETYVYRDSDLDPQKLPGYQSDVLIDEAMRQIGNYDRESPLFLVVSIEPPHFPCLAPDASKRFDPNELKVDPSFAKLDAFFEGHLPSVEEKTMREILANYYSMIENLDENIGRLVDFLRKQSGFEDTLLIYVSDHGDYAGNHGINTCKINHHEESVRIPAVFSWPGEIPAQGKVPGLFSLVDLQATVLGLVGVAPMPSDQGHDWSANLRGASVEGPQEVLLEMCGAPRWTPKYLDWRGYVTDRWKYAFYEDGRECLHDLKNDPHELTNLAADATRCLEEHRQRLRRLLAESREPYFDVLMEHGVKPEPTTYIRDEATQLANIRRLGGLDTSDQPLPMA